MKEVYYVVCNGQRVACCWTYEEARAWMTEISSLEHYAGKDLYVRKGRLD